MSSHFTVIYDACVLYPAPLRDLLMYLAMTDLYRARWSGMIHDEWMRNVLKNRPDLSFEQLQNTRKLMDQHVPHCLVSGFEPLIEALQLPDPDDRHVLAAAIHAGADLILSFNLKDFPEQILNSYNLCVQHPDDFIVDLLDLHPAKVLQAIAAHRGALRKPPKNVAEYLETLQQQGLTQSVAQLRPWSAAI